MKDFVSNRWMHVLALAGSTAAVWAMFTPSGLPWTGLVFLSLAFSAALWVGTSSTRSIAQVLVDIEAEPVQAIATPARVAPPVPKAVL